MLRPDIADYLKGLRKDANLKQKELASEFGVTESYISQIENGKEPSDEIVAKYSEKFRLSVSDLYVAKRKTSVLGLELKNHRKKAGLDIGQLEDKTGIDYFRIAEIEQGEAEPSPDEISLLCQALELEPEQFEDSETLLFNQLRDILQRLGLDKNKVEHVEGYVFKNLIKK